MPRTIVKTGAVFQCATGSFNEHDSDLPPMAKCDKGHFYVYGDLHAVGNCGVLYMPPVQEVCSPVHGLISFVGTYFFRRSRIDHMHDVAFVFPMQRLALKHGVLHPYDFPLFTDAGGRVWNVA